MSQICCSFVQDVFEIYPRIFECLAIHRQRLDQLDIPNPPALQTTDRTTKQPPQYKTNPEFFEYLLEWKELEIWSLAILDGVGPVDNRPFTD